MTINCIIQFPLIKLEKECLKTVESLVQQLKYIWIKAMQMWTLRGLGKGVPYIAIGLKWRENNIEEPEEEKDGGGDVLEHSVAAKLGALPVLAEDGQEPPGHDQADGDHGADDVDRHREGQSARLHLEAIGLKMKTCVNENFYYPAALLQRWFRQRLTLEKW